jgi:peptide/nickel transport system substrate-binding protein
LAVGGGFVWVSVVPDGVVFKLSKDDLSLRANPAAGPDPERISYGGDQLWIANPASNTVSRVAPNGGRQEFVAEAVPAVAAYHDGLVWVGAARVLPPLPPIQGQELRLATMSDAGLRLDPLQGGLWDEQLRYATCATLLNYPDSAGPRGSRLRPEIAAAMPTLSRDRRTYTFRIRPGFRFSPPSNEPVTAQTFRHTLERALAPANRDFGAWVLSDIVGASAYTAGRAEHVSGIAVRGSALSITLVKPAGDFLARISLLRFCPVPLSIPVPRSIPIRPNGPPTPIASAGPYYVASSAGGRTVLLRNPNYPGKRPRRSERIVYESDVPEAQAIALADRGAVDFLPGFDASDLLSPGGPIDRRYGSGSTAARRGAQRYFLYQAPIYDYLAFNTRRPLFRDDRLRRAVNYALDRRALARAFGDSPADQVVPPAVPGYPAGRIYPTDGPDLTTARRLAGGRERRTILYMCGDPRERTLARIIARNLAKIRMAISTVEAKDCPGPGDGLSARADLFLVSGWPWLESDERDPGLFIDKALRAGLYGNPLGPGPWRRHDFEKRLERARLLVGPARIDRYRRLSDELTRDAPFAVFGSWVWPEYFSPKVGCKLFHPVYGVVDLGALCIRV